MRSSGRRGLRGSEVESRWSVSFEQAWLSCADLFCRAVEEQAVRATNAPEHELLFCLLGGHGISYELALSATTVIARLRPFAETWDPDEIRDAVANSLGEKQFAPTCKDGSLRRYRFPERKADTIVAAGAWLRETGPLEVAVMRHSDAKSRREFLCGCPGVGPKTASWLLRNLGWAEELAIIDVHVLRLLSDLGRIDETVRLPRDYDKVERVFLQLCEELQAPAAALDLFVWEWQRGTLWLS